MSVALALIMAVTFTPTVSISLTSLISIQCFRLKVACSAPLTKSPFQPEDTAPLTALARPKSAALSVLDDFIFALLVYKFDLAEKLDKALT